MQPILIRLCTDICNNHTVRAVTTPVQSRSKSIFHYS